MPINEEDNLGLIGQSDAIRELRKQIRLLAEEKVSVLIRGETGTGKELVAAALQKCSNRRDMDYVKVNASAFVMELLQSELFGHEQGAFAGAVRRRRGRFELADRGTLFLDEIGDILPRMQVALLRVLEYGTFERVGGEKTLKVDVRVMAATHRNLEEMIKNGEFREDLYHRLGEIQIRVPPLRERKEDIFVLVDYFMKNHGLDIRNRPYPLPIRLTPEALESLQNYNWPGNVRQLRHVIRQALIVCHNPLIGLEELPEDIRGFDYKKWIVPVADNGIRDQIVGPIVAAKNGERASAWLSNASLDATNQNNASQSESKSKEVPTENRLLRIRIQILNFISVAQDSEYSSSWLSQANQLLGKWEECIRTKWEQNNKATRDAALLAGQMVFKHIDLSEETLKFTDAYQSSCAQAFVNLTKDYKFSQEYKELIIYLSQVSNIHAHGPSKDWAAGQSVGDDRKLIPFIDPEGKSFGPNSSGEGKDKPVSLTSENKSYDVTSPEERSDLVHTFRQLIEQEVTPEFLQSVFDQLEELASKTIENILSSYESRSADIQIVIDSSVEAIGMSVWVLASEREGYAYKILDKLDQVVEIIIEHSCLKYTVNSYPYLQLLVGVCKVEQVTSTPENVIDPASGSASLLLSEIKSYCYNDENGIAFFKLDSSSEPPELSWANTFYILAASAYQINRPFDYRTVDLIRRALMRLNPTEGYGCLARIGTFENGQIQPKQDQLEAPSEHPIVSKTFSEAVYGVSLFALADALPDPGRKGSYGRNLFDGSKGINSIAQMVMSRWCGEHGYFRRQPGFDENLVMMRTMCMCSYFLEKWLRHKLVSTTGIFKLSHIDNGEKALYCITKGVKSILGVYKKYHTLYRQYYRDAKSGVWAPHIRTEDTVSYAYFAKMLAESRRLSELKPELAELKPERP